MRTYRSRRETTSYEDYIADHKLWVRCSEIDRKMCNIPVRFFATDEYEKIQQMMEGDEEMINLAQVIIDEKYNRWIIEQDRASKNKHYIFPRDKDQEKLRARHFKKKI